MKISSLQAGIKVSTVGSISCKVQIGARQDSLICSCSILICSGCTLVIHSSIPSKASFIAGFSISINTSNNI